MTIRELRQDQGWTQLDLAIRLGVTPATVYNWEAGRHVPSLTRRRKLARVFGCSMTSIDLGRSINDSDLDERDLAH